MQKTNVKKLFGDAVKAARVKMGVTQNEAAEKANVDPKTILNIENYRGNPTLQVMFSIICALNIDPKEIFCPEADNTNSALYQMKLLISDCTENEANVMFSICNPLKETLRKNYIEVK